MSITYDVKVWAIERRQHGSGTTYRVRWSVAGRRRTRTFKTVALAESFRAELLTATRKGEAFDADDGLPASRPSNEISTISWYDFAREYVAARWPRVSPKHRKGIAEALTTPTVAMLTGPLPSDQAVAIRSAITNWALIRRDDPPPADVADHLSWVARRSRPLHDLTKPVVMRGVLDAMLLRLDGRRASGRTATWKRSIFSTAMRYAVEVGYLDHNPVPAVSWTAPRTNHSVDRRVVVNPDQARALLAAVGTVQRSGPMLVAFFGCMYSSALRPEEVAHLKASNVHLPAEGWGRLLLDQAAPEVASKWTDSGQTREARELKHRAVGDTRAVPCPPPLVILLRQHIDRFGTAQDGRLFRSEDETDVSGGTYRRIWREARQRTLTPQQVASPLAARPYDLRHAAVSTWLNSGVPPTQVAEWAGHSVAVLLKIYARCLDGSEASALQRIEQMLDAVVSEPQQ